VARLDATAFLLTAGVFIVYGCLPGRALLRLVLSRDLIPPPLLRERPAVAALVAGAAMVGTYMLAILGIMSVRRLDGSMEDFNAAPAVMLFLMSYAFALLTGELVLIGNGWRDQEV